MNLFNKYLDQTTHAAQLAVFRICFGFMMLISIVRFWSLGWIEKLYIQPGFFFSYYGFEFVHPLGKWTYAIFIICGIAALLVALGYQYRLAIVTFFLSFTYIELMDKTTYLNHYYFISLLSFLLIFLPAGCYFSLDARFSSSKTYEYLPRWNVDALKLLLAIVYFYAGLAKLNSDWLLDAMPLKIWLPGKNDLPLIGGMMDNVSIIYVFSWVGAIYDLSIPFLLWWKKTRTIAFVIVVFFHAMTRILFPIGMFPYIMIVCTLIFFDAKFHKKVIQTIGKVFRIRKDLFNNGRKLISEKSFLRSLKISFVLIFFVVQLAIPFRHLLYPGELFWTEEGFRFSWRVMLMEKAGIATFKVVNAQTGKRFYVDNSDFLSTFQEKQMATQPDFIVQYAHYLGKHFRQQGHENLEIYVESYVALNGRLSRPFIDPETNLLSVNDSFAHKDWILPFSDEIKGL